MLKKLSPLALAGIAVALTGTAYAATRNTHSMNVHLPDGAVAHIEYVGDVAPRVTVAPAPLPNGFWATALPDFGGFDRMFEQMDRQMHQIEQMARLPSGAPNNMNVASYGSLPAGATSVTVVSTSNGNATCTRQTEVVSQGPGKPPKVTSNVSGNCAASAQPAPQATPKGTALDRT